MHPIFAPPRFGTKIRIADSGCWEWTASLANGYGQYAIKTSRPKRNRSSHRFAYEWFVGPIPAGMQIDHLCRNRACCNPEHLDVVTNAENSRRGAHGRLVTACVNGHEYTPKNTRIRANGRRACKECSRLQAARKLERLHDQGLTSRGTPWPNTSRMCGLR